MATPPSPPSTRSSILSAPQVVKGLVSEFFEEKKRETEELARAAAPRKRSPAKTIVMGALCGVVWFAPVPGGEADPFADVAATGAAAQRGLQSLAVTVADYYLAHNRLPRTLVEAGIEDSVMYVAGTREFSLSVTLGGNTFSHSTSVDTLLAARDTTGMVGK